MEKENLGKSNFYCLCDWASTYFGGFREYGMDYNNFMVCNITGFDTSKNNDCSKLDYVRIVGKIPSIRKELFLGQYTDGKIINCVIISIFENPVESFSREKNKVIQKIELRNCIFKKSDEGYDFMTNNIIEKEEEEEEEEFLVFKCLLDFESINIVKKSRIINVLNFTSGI